MNVLLISPGYPPEMPYFTRGLAEVGADVIGLGDGPKEALPELTRKHLSAYLRVPSLWDEGDVVEVVLGEVRRTGARIDRVECLWEVGMLLAARLREALGVPGMTVDQTVPFRDKEQMKQVLDQAGIRTPHHASARTATECRAAAERIGYPIIIKPIAGAGSADTYRIEDNKELEQILPRVRHVPEVSVEEFIEAEEFTFDTVCANHEILYENIAQYRPRPLIARSFEWISPQTMVLRDIDVAELEQGRTMGHKVLKALDYEYGFTHMEWHRKDDGEAVFGEIGARPAGARTVDTMNFACDIDLFTGWAEAVCHGRLSQPVERKYNAVQICKRAQGQGRIQRIEGLHRLLSDFGEWIVQIDLLPPGTPRRDWLQTLLSDGYVVLRHPDLETAWEMSSRVATELRIFAE